MGWTFIRQMEFQHLMNSSLICSLIIYPPDVNPCILTEGFGCEFPGYEMELLGIVGTKLNLSFTFIIPSDNQFGAFINGSWNGIVGQLMNGLTNVSCKLLTYTETRNTAVDFSYPIKYAKQGFLIRNPGAEASEIEFTKVVNWQFFVLLFCTFLAFFAISIVDSRIRSLRDKPTVRPTFAFYMFLTGGSNDDPNESWGLRIFTSVTLLMFGIVYTYFFTIFLESSLIVKNVVAFGNAQELASLIKNNNYRLIADSLSTAWYVEVYNSRIEQFVILKSVLDIYPPIIEVNQTKIIDLIYSNPTNLVYTHNVDILRSLVDSRCDKYLIIEDNTPYLSFASFGFPKNSPYKSAFSWALMDMNEYAENTLKKRYYPFLPCDKISNSMDNYGIVQTTVIKSTIYFVVILGISFLALLLELAGRYKKRFINISIVIKKPFKHLIIWVLK